MGSCRGNFQKNEQNGWLAYASRPFCSFFPWSEAASRRLLRFLLIHGRVGRRGTLMDALWLDSASSYLEEYLNKGISNLRRVLRNEELILLNTARTTYYLADQSRVWCDVDACEEIMQEVERVGPASAEGCRLLELAQSYFARGHSTKYNRGKWRTSGSE